MDPFNGNAFEFFLALMWKPVLLLVGFIVLFGILKGIFTYGQRTKRPKYEDFGDLLINGISDVTQSIIHALAGQNRGRQEQGSWLDDTQILAMLRGMNPSEFEEYIAKVFTALGYETLPTGGAGDGGVDIEMTKNGKQYVVQCKKFFNKHKVNPHDVRDFYGAMGDRHINGKGFFITTNIFTHEAEAFAEDKPIELIDSSGVVALVRESGLLGSPHQVQDGKDHCPKCGSPLIERTNRENGIHFLGCVRFPDCKFTKPV